MREIWFLNMYELIHMEIRIKTSSKIHLRCLTFFFLSHMYKLSIFLGKKTHCEKDTIMQTIARYAGRPGSILDQGVYLQWIFFLISQRSEMSNLCINL